MTLHEWLLPLYRNMLRAVGGMIDRAAEQDESDALLAKRLAPDMLPLASQLRFVANMPGEALTQLAGGDYRSLDEDPADLAEAKTWLSQTLLRLDGVKEADWRAEEDTFELTLPNGMVFHLTAGQYARDWAVPNFLFHTSMVYAILRHSGIELGKADFVPHMLAYVKTSP